jgi:Tol biopolymer transport system component
MPDFDTRRPQEQNLPNEPRIGLIANKLRSALMATRLRALLMGGGILLFVMAVLVGLLIYSTSRLDDQPPFVLSYADDIWTMNIAGSDLQQLTATDELEESTVDSQPAWSPDHQRIAFVRSQEYEPPSSESGSSETQNFIYVMNADGFWQRKLLDAASASGPTWSPDGERIAFSADLSHEGTTSIYVMNSDGSGEPKRLSTGAGDLNPAWSPDGKEIAFERRGGGIYVMKACCGKYYTAWRRTKQLTAGPGEDREAVWSPDGSELAFTHIEFGEGLYGAKEIRNTDVYKIDADGSRETRLTDTYSSPEHDAVWSPSRDELAFIEGYYAGTSAECYDTIYLMESDASLPYVVRRVPDACEMDLDWR